MDASKIIDEKLAKLGDWRGEQMRAIRKAIRQVDPDIVEEWKWMGTPVWNHNGIICLANAHKKVVKITFHKGAQLPDPKKAFNNGLNGGRWRSIDIAEGDKLDVDALKGLVKAAIALNAQKPAARKATAGAASVTAKKSAKKKAVAKPAARAKKKAVAKKARRAATKPTAKKRAAKKK